ncbi:MAG: DUF3575 domain-containing protein [Chitinophagaceae bacterium]
MKKLIIILAIAPFFANSQKLIGGKNIIKTNLTGDAIGNYNLTYERSILKKMSFSVGVRYMAKQSLPFQSEMQDLIGNNDIKIADFKMGNFAITPELRFYLSAGKMKGFYIAPYARYASFDLAVPILYVDPNNASNRKEVLFDGKITSFSGGLLLGVQTQIFKKLVLDVWIAGGHYGSSNGTLDGDFSKNPLASDQDVKNLQDKLDNISVDAGPFTFKGNVVSKTQAVINSTGPWAGIRALGLSIGVRF